MSKIGTEVIVGQIFKPIVTTFTYEELKNYRDNDISIGINNAVIFSIPQQGLDDESSVDNHEETSIWATDNSGLLCPLSFPYSMISKIRDSFKNYEENINDKKIVSVTWVSTQGSSEAGTSPNINIKVQVKYANNRTALLNITGIKVYKNPQFTEEYVTVIAGGETINWYDKAGVYYLQGLVTDTATGSIMATTNDLPLEWTITEINKQIPSCTQNVILHGTYAEIQLSANVSGMFEITYYSDGNLDTNFGKILRGNDIVTFKLYNESYNIINPMVKYTFTPDNTKYYTIVNDSFTIDGIEGLEEPHVYYWYAGLTLPKASNIASIALDSSHSVQKWNGKEFTITNNEGYSTPAYVCTPIDFKVSWKDMNGFTINLVEVDGSEFEYDGIYYKVQRRGRVLSSGASLTVRGYYTN